MCGNRGTYSPDSTLADKDDPVCQADPDFDDGLNAARGMLTAGVVGLAVWVVFALVIWLA